MTFIWSYLKNLREQMGKSQQGFTANLTIVAVLALASMVALAIVSCFNHYILNKQSAGLAKQAELAHEIIAVLDHQHLQSIAKERFMATQSKTPVHSFTQSGKQVIQKIKELELLVGKNDSLEKPVREELIGNLRKLPRKQNDFNQLPEFDT